MGPRPSTSMPSMPTYLLLASHSSPIASLAYSHPPCKRARPLKNSHHVSKLNHRSARFQAGLGGLDAESQHLLFRRTLSLSSTIPLRSTLRQLDLTHQQPLACLVTPPTPPDGLAPCSPCLTHTACLPARLSALPTLTCLLSPACPNADVCCVCASCQSSNLSPTIAYSTHSSQAPPPASSPTPSVPDPAASFSLSFYLHLHLPLSLQPLLRRCVFVDALS